MRAVDVVCEERGIEAEAASRWLRRVLRAHPELRVTRVATGRGGGKVAYCDGETEAALRALCHRVATEAPKHARSARDECAEALFECTTHESLAVHARLAKLELAVEEIRHALACSKLAGRLGEKKISPRVF